MTNMIVINLFYATWADGSFEICQEIKHELAALQVNIHDIEMSSRAWALTGMRTVPAAEIRNELGTLRLLPGNPTADSIRGFISDVALPSVKAELIRPVEVIASSGSHRYGRWNEYFLFEDDLNKGWSSPSRKSAVDEELTFDLMQLWRIRSFHLLPRNSVVDKEYEKSFPSQFVAYLSIDGEHWTLAAHSVSGNASVGGACVVNMDGVARFVRLVMKNVGLRTENKYFTQIMRIDFWGTREPVRTEGIQLAKGRLPSQRADIDQAVKYGMFYAAEGCVVSLWTIPEHKDIPKKWIKSGKIKYIVLTGRLTVSHAGSDRPVELGAGEWLLQHKDMWVSMANTGVGPSQILEIATADVEDLWGVRHA